LKEIAEQFRLKRPGDEQGRDKREEEKPEVVAESVRKKYENLLPPDAIEPASPSENQEMLAKIVRYETGLMNSINRTLKMLIGLQSMRGKAWGGSAYQLV
jgi:hypothetical protein